MPGAQGRPGHALTTRKKAIMALALALLGAAAATPFSRRDHPGDPRIPLPGVLAANAAGTSRRCPPGG